MFEKPHRRFIAAVAGVATMLAIYSWLNGRFESAFDFTTGLDGAIPLVPWSVPIYASLYLLAPLGAVLVDSETFVRGLKTLALVAIVSFAGFILLPAAYPRPNLATVDSIWRPALAWYYANDPPLNTFPSLHVATAAVMSWMLRGVGRWWIWAGWAGLIALSTLTTKQHFVADVVGGLIVAAAAVAIVERTAQDNVPLADQ